MHRPKPPTRESKRSGKEQKSAKSDRISGFFGIRPVRILFPYLDIKSLSDLTSVSQTLRQKNREEYFRRAVEALSKFALDNGIAGKVLVENANVEKKNKWSRNTYSGKSTISFGR